jgi:integrase
MAVVPRKNTKTIVFWIVFTWRGERVWERVGTDRRAAERLEAQRKREVKTGTYQPPSDRHATTLGAWGGEWASKRKTRNADQERSALDRYVFGRPWLAEMKIADLRPKDVNRLVDELYATVSEATGKPLSTKTVANVYGTVRTLVRDARLAEVLAADPCVLPRGRFRRKSTARRTPYTSPEIHTLTTHEAIPIAYRMWVAVAFYTGMREGEVCGRRWRDWDREAKPLGRLDVHSQYDDRPLKTETEKGDQPRAVPVHPNLAALLGWWWREGWELVHCRKPTPADFIVPNRDASAHTKSSAYKAWRRACDVSGVGNRTLHATRHTFVTVARRHGARKEVLERVTHNAQGDIVDTYTHWDWAPLCEAVLCFKLDPGVDSTVEPSPDPSRIVVEARGIEPRSENALLLPLRV